MEVSGNFGNLYYYLSLLDFMAGLPSVSKDSTVMTLTLVRVMQASHKGSIDLLFCKSIWITWENFVLKRFCRSLFFFSNCLLNEYVARKMGHRISKMDVICTRVFLTRKQAQCTFNKSE